MRCQASKTKSLYLLLRVARVSDVNDEQFENQTAVDGALTIGKRLPGTAPS